MSAQAGQINRLAAIKLAQTMYEGGWSVNAIQQYLEGRGLRAGWLTVKRWAIPEFAELDQARSRTRERRRWAERTGGRLGRRDQTAETKLVRLVALHEKANLSCSAIARLMDLDFGDRLSQDQVRYALRTGQYPKRASQAGTCQIKETSP